MKKIETFEIVSGMEGYCRLMETQDGRGGESRGKMGERGEGFLRGKCDVYWTYTAVKYEKSGRYT